MSTFSTTTTGQGAGLVSKRITPRSQPDRALGSVLRQLREQNGLSAEKLAQEASLTVSAYLRIEAAVSAPGWSTVRRIAEALDVSMAELGRMVEAER
jgi:transcriptional regulator with XRE-family HTH domain